VIQMINFLIGLFLGGAIGFAVAALCAVSSDDK
jgi:hypothetical protein